MRNSGFRGIRGGDNSGVAATPEQFLLSKRVTPSITSLQLTDTLYNPIDDIAANPAGGQTVVLTGTGFKPGMSVIVGDTYASEVNYINGTTLAFKTPALAAGYYILYVINNYNNGVGTLIPGIRYSTYTSFVMASGYSLADVYETQSYTSQIIATSDSPIQYTVIAGSLPPGASIDQDLGVITGTAQIEISAAAYSFTLKATDADGQDVTRSYNITIRPDAVNWISPLVGTTYNVVAGEPITPISLTANSLSNNPVVFSSGSFPLGLAVSGNSIIGAITTVTTSTLSATITAISTGSNKVANNTINWIVNLGDTYRRDNIFVLSSNSAVINTGSNSVAYDSSMNNLPMTVTGEAHLSSLTPYGPGSYSGYFNGANSYLGHAVVNTTSDLNFTSGASFTLELWVYPLHDDNVANNYTFINYGTYKEAYPSERVIWMTALSCSIFISAGSTTAATEYKAFYPVTKIPNNRWSHIALVRNGSSLTAYYNGQPGASVTASGAAQPLSSRYDLAGPHGWWYGVNSTNWTGFVPTIYRGYMHNVRYLNGTALYTAQFTPPTDRLTMVVNTKLLSFQDKTIKAYADVNAKTWTYYGSTYIKQFSNITTSTSYSPTVHGGSMFFSTLSTNGITTPANALFSFGSGAFTVEAWVYTITSKIHGVVSIKNGSVGWTFRINANDTIQFFYVASSTITSTGTIPKFCWTHIAASRVVNTVTLYIDGVASGAGTFGAETDTLTQLVVGQERDGTNSFYGYITGLKITKGTGLYTGAFTPPTALMTTASSTSLLLNFNSGIPIYDATNNTAILNTSSAVVVDTGFKRQGNSSLYFNGTNACLVTPTDIANKVPISFADFTIELWAYPTALPATADTTIFSIGVGSSGYEIRIAQNVDGTGYGYVLPLSARSSSQSAGFGSLTLNQWAHLAITKSGSTVRFFKNGTTITTLTSQTWDFDTGPALANRIYIGRGQSDATPNFFKGYICDVRITRSVSRYTADFGPYSGVALSLS